MKPAESILWCVIGAAAISAAGIGAISAAGNAIVCDQRTEPQCRAVAWDEHTTEVVRQRDIQRKLDWHQAEIARLRDEIHQLRAEPQPVAPVTREQLKLYREPKQ